MSTSNKRRSDVTTEIVVGAFMFTILVVLLTITVVISQNRFFQDSYRIETVFPDVGGLKEGEGVFLRGVKIGNVEGIEIAEGLDGVRVIMRLNRDIVLYEDYQMFVEPSSMLGGMRMILDEGSHQLGEIPKERYDNLDGQGPRDLLSEATETIEMIRKALVDDGTLENLNKLSENLAGVSEKVARGEGTVGRLVQDESLYNEARDLVATLNHSATDLRQLAKDARAVGSRLAEGKGMVGKLLSADEGAYNSLTNTLEQVSLAGADARKVLGRVERGEGTLGKLLSGDDQMYRDLEDTMANFKEFSGSLAEGEGTVSRLIKDDTLYIKIEALVEEARATIDDFRETSPITTFSSVFFGAF